MGTTDAECCLGINPQPSVWKTLAAQLTIATGAFVHPFQRQLEPPRLDIAAALPGFGHGLVLQGVHPAEPAQSSLVQFDNRASCLCGLGFLLQHRQVSGDQVAEKGKIGIIHFLLLPRSRIAVGQIHPIWLD